MDANYDALENAFPAIFDEWDIVRKLGKGSYCDVYEVTRKIGGTAEEKAVKHISFPRDSYELQAICSELGTSDPAVIRDYIHHSVEEFEREYLIMSDLGGQTNTVSCQDIRKFEKKDMPGYDIFFFMELLTSVATISRERTMSEAEITQLGIDICKALELLEKRNIIHRDIKPENLFVNKDGDYKLGDFGAARLLGGVQNVVTSKGTPAYMPPEIAQMKPAGTYSDIYSLGLVMYRLLNNNLPPFADDGSNLSTTTMELASGKRLTGEKLPKPINGSKGLTAIVMKATEFDPAKRYQKASQMREALEELQSAGNKSRESNRKSPRKSKEGEEPAPQAAAVPPVQQNDDNIRKVTMTEAEKARIKEERRLEEIRRKKEAEKAAAKKKEENKKKLRKALISVVAVIAALAVTGVIVKLVGDSQKKKNAYKEAVAFLEGGKYDEANEAFAVFEDTYEDTAAKKKEINDWLSERERQLTSFKQKAEDGDYGTAIREIKNMKSKFPENRQEELQKLIDDYQVKLDEKNANEAQIAKYEQELTQAEKLLQEDDTVDQAIEKLEGLISNQYNTAKVQETYEYALDKQQFIAGKERLKNGDFAGAIGIFEKLGSFEGAAEQKKEAEELKLIEKAGSELAAEQYEEVKKTLANISRTEARTLTEKAEKGIENQEVFAGAMSDMDDARKILELNSRDYDKAIAKYNTAGEKFKGLKDFSVHGDKAGDRYTECENWVNYLTAKSYMDAGDTENLQKARTRFEKLAQVGEGGFENAATMVNLVDQQLKILEAESAYQGNQLEAAENRYNELRELGDAAGADRGIAKVNNRRAWQAAQSQLNQGIKERNAELITGAKDAFNSLNGFEGAGEKAAECDKALVYLTGLQQMDDRQYGAAKATFESLGDYRDAATRKENAEYSVKAEETYNNAKTLMSYGSYDQAMQSFQGISGFWDAKEQAELCQQHMLYEDANNNIALGRMEAARKILENLQAKNFGGAEARIADINRYESAVMQQAEKNYSAAKEGFDALGSFYDAEKRAKECGDEITYATAVSIMEQDPVQAKSLFEKIIGLHDDCYTRLERCNNLIAYRNAAAERDAGHVEKAYDMFSKLDKFEDSEAQAAKLGSVLDFKQAQEYAGKGEFDKAIGILEHLSGDEATVLLLDCRFQRGAQLEKEGKYEEALAMYNMVQGYADSDARAKNCGYQLFLGRMRDKGSVLDTLQQRCFHFIYYYDGYSDKDAWGDRIVRQPQQGVDTPVSFAVSLDLAAVTMSNRDKVEALYQIMLGRTMDENGEVYVKALDNGMSMKYLIEDIRKSVEFELNCATLGIPVGEVALTEPRDFNYFLTGYVYRCYHDLLGREQPAYEELNQWCSMYWQGAISLPDMIRFFANSDEMKSRQLSNDDYITAIYRTLLDRDPDEGGRNNAQEYFRLGYSADAVLEGLLGSFEFADNLNKQNLAIMVPAPAPAVEEPTAAPAE